MVSTPIYLHSVNLIPNTLSSCSELEGVFQWQQEMVEGSVPPGASSGCDRHNDITFYCQLFKNSDGIRELGDCCHGTGALKLQGNLQCRSCLASALYWKQQSNGKPHEPIPMWKTPQKSIKEPTKGVCGEK